MRAHHIRTNESISSLVDIPIPTPNEKQVLVEIHACSLNFADLLMENGTYQDTPQKPFTLGLEAAGRIASIGKQVKGLSKGDRVVVFGGQGGLAEFGVFDQFRVTKIPDRMSYESAAAMQIAYGTSHIALAHCARLQPEETLLVLGAAGGVGLTAVEIGKLMGARVIACARGDDKLQLCANKGADLLIDADTDDLRGALLDLGGIDVVYDPVGGDLFKAAFRACKPGGRLLPIGFASGTVPQIPANHLLVKNLSVHGFYWGGYLHSKPELIQQSTAQLIEWCSEGRLTPHIGQTLPLERASEGLEMLRSRKSVGKVVITMNH